MRNPLSVYYYCDAENCYGKAEVREEEDGKWVGRDLKHNKVFLKCGLPLPPTWTTIGDQHFCPNHDIIIHGEVPVGEDVEITRTGGLYEPIPDAAPPKANERTFPCGCHAYIDGVRCESHRGDKPEGVNCPMNSLVLASPPSDAAPHKDAALLRAAAADLDWMATRRAGHTKRLHLSVALCEMADRIDVPSDAAPVARETHPQKINDQI